MTRTPNVSRKHARTSLHHLDDSDVHGTVNGEKIKTGENQSRETGSSRRKRSGGMRLDQLDSSDVTGKASEFDFEEWKRKREEEGRHEQRQAKTAAQQAKKNELKEEDVWGSFETIRADRDIEKETTDRFDPDQERQYKRLGFSFFNSKEGRNPEVRMLAFEPGKTTYSENLDDFKKEKMVIYKSAKGNALILFSKSGPARERPICPLIEPKEDCVTSVVCQSAILHVWLAILRRVGLQQREIQSRRGSP